MTTRFSEIYQKDSTLPYGGHNRVYTADFTLKSGKTCKCIVKQIEKLYYRECESDALTILGPIGLAPRLYDIVCEGNNINIVMQFIKGETLQSLIYSRKGMLLIQKKNVGKEFIGSNTGNS